MANSQFNVSHWIYRWIAAIIDSIIPLIIGYILFYVIIAPALWTVNLGFFGTFVDTPAWGHGFLFPLITGVLWVLYAAYFEASRNGQTLGKKLLSLQVQTTNGAPLDFNKALTRNITKIYGPLLLLDWILGIITSSSDKRQKFFDRIAGTTVVSVRQELTVPPPPPPPPPP